MANKKKTRKKGTTDGGDAGAPTVNLGGVATTKRMIANASVPGDGVCSRQKGLRLSHEYAIRR